MKPQTFAPIALAGTSHALSLLGVDVNLPLGIDIDILSNLGNEPTTGPCDECTNVYHPPHHGIDMDECDNDEDDGWHWVHPGKPHYPEAPEYTWGTSTVTCEETSTIIGCPPGVEHCPGKSTVYTTVTEVKSTTICPVPIVTPSSEYHAPPTTAPYVPAKPSTSEYYAPPTTEPYVPVKPTTSVHYPPKVTTEPYVPVEPTTSVYYPPKVTTTIYPDVEYPETIPMSKPSKFETSVYYPPASTTTVWVPPVVDTPEYPAPPAEDCHDCPDYPAPPTEHQPEYPDYVEPPAETPIGPGNNTIPPPPVTAGASQTVQHVGLAAFAMVAAALL